MVVLGRTNPPGASEIGVPEIVAPGPLALSVVPATTTADGPAGVIGCPATVARGVGAATGAGAARGMVLVPRTRPALLSEMGVLPIVAAGAL